MIKSLLVAALMFLFPSCCHGDPAPQTRDHQVVRLNFKSEVSDAVVTKTLKALDQIETLHPAGLLIVIDTPGGDLDAGLRLVQRLEALPFPVTCLVDGEADSEGFFILQACTHRYMTGRSRLMAHEPFAVTDGPQALTRKFLQEQSQFQDTMSLSWSTFAAHRMRITVTEFRHRIYLHNWWMAAPEALSVGAVDGVAVSSDSAWKSFQQDLSVR